MKPNKPGKKRRKSLRKEAIKITAEGSETRIHFTLKEGEPQAELETYTPNPDLIKFGQITVGDKTLKAYAFKNCKNLAFLRINNQFLALNKYKLRELMSFVQKEAWYIGLYGKRTSKYD